MQSRNWCFPLRTVICAKDSKKTLEGFCNFYDQFNCGLVSLALGCCPFKMSYPGDVKLQWAALDKGGAAKVKEQFCYVCSCNSSILHVPRDPSNSELCKDSNNVWCYHYKFLASSEVREELAEEVAVISALVEGAVHDGGGQQRMYARKEGQVVVEGDMLDIDFQPASAMDTALFSRQVTDERSSRSVNATGPLAARRERLRQQLVNENRVRHVGPQSTARQDNVPGFTSCCVHTSS